MGRFHNKDVITQFRLNGRKWPLGRYLANIVRQESIGEKGLVVQKEKELILDRLLELKVYTGDFIEINNAREQREALRRQHAHKANFINSRGKSRRQI